MASQIKTAVTIGNPPVEYEVSTCLTFDRGWETMIFNNINGDSDVSINGVDYHSLHVNEQAAQKWHNYVVTELTGGLPK